MKKTEYFREVIACWREKGMLFRFYSWLINRKPAKKKKWKSTN